MQLNVIVFGQLKDITGSSLSLENISDTDQLVEKLNHLYPGLRKKKYVIAVDKRIITANTSLNNNNTVALLPPFSGG